MLFQCYCYTVTVCVFTVLWPVAPTGSHLRHLSITCARRTCNLFISHCIVVILLVWLKNSQQLYPWVASSDQALSTGWGEHSCKSGRPRRTDAITWSVTSRGDTVLTSPSRESRVFTARRFAATPDIQFTCESRAGSLWSKLRHSGGEQNKHNPNEIRIDGRSRGQSLNKWIKHMWC